MNFWLLKSEPSSWSWSDQKKVKTTIWDGVRNYQARNNLMAMKKHDKCFFYHSVSEKKIVGIVSVVKEYYLDPTDKTKKFVAIKVRFEKKLELPVSLKSIKKTKELKDLPLIKQSRLSVMPISTKHWKNILNMSKIVK